ncbi:c-type cytochrome [Variovorax sp. PAMC26660]|uniref:c-type cytochrome n=1 Tax=Variovorax sp. PAMC26660 TaxID=2762322 RepID=UPI00164D44B0|nr:c-type cytochrome [Variovorax sp. PAMC26660]QNK69971.1 c-type cytochrome [Variovorax sp. PAMC26660]
MSSSPERAALRALLALAACSVCIATWAQPKTTGYPGIGRDATPKEVAAWDIDVRPDFKGLPPGSGSVTRGQDVWESKCASCHGVFGESNQVFSPIVGGTTADDIKTGHVARLKDPAFPGRTTLMKASSLSTVWDYVYRAMPWNQPKSLTPDDVYAVTAYILNLGGIVPDDFTLSDKNIREVQARMPNRNGATTAHAMWPGTELGRAVKPDVTAVACMHDCVPAEQKVAQLPPHARGSHGNLADQNRLVGAQHGIETAPPAAKTAAPQAAATSKVPTALLEKNSCVACHGMTQKLVGPAFSDIAKKYPGQTDHLLQKIKAGGSGVWGAIPMPPQTIADDEAKAIARWLAESAAPEGKP